MTPKTPPAASLSALWTRHADEEGAVVRDALDASGWALRAASRALGVQVSTLQRVLRRHPTLERDRKRRMAKPYAGA